LKSVLFGGHDNANRRQLCKRGQTGLRKSEAAMSWDEETPKKKPAFEIGADLSKFSVDDLTDYINLLDAERQRAESIRAAKRSSRDAADSVFKR
jgi:uncharacterized small protein (DUF1192 family)